MPSLTRRRRHGLLGMGSTDIWGNPLNVTAPNLSTLSFNTAANDVGAVSAPSVGGGNSLATDIMTGMSTAGSILTNYYTTTAQVNQAKQAAIQANNPFTPVATGSGVVTVGAQATNNLMPWLLIGGLGLVGIVLLSGKK